MKHLAFALLTALVGCFIPDAVDPGTPANYSSPASEYSGGQAPDVPPRGPPPPPQPAFVRVSILGALIAPSKADGHTWDGPGHVAPETTSKVVGALATAHPYAAVAALMAGMSMSAFDKPDPYGYAELLGPGLAASLDLPMVYRDTFTPSWNADFVHVPLRDGVRIRITLIDKDLEDDDPIGTVELAARDLRDALGAGNVFPIRVAEQSNNQLLFVNVSVAAE